MDFPSFEGQGHSIDLLDEQLILLGGKRKFEYNSIHQPRKGLLGIKFSTEASLEGSIHHWHTSHVFGNQLLAIGGKSGSKDKLSNTAWKSLNLVWQNGSQFSRFASGACTVRVSRNVYILIGGLEQEMAEIEELVEMNTVLRLDVEKEKVEELPQIKMNRAFHSCEVDGENILIAGGVKGSDVVADEIYNLKNKNSLLLEMSSSLKRHQHALQRLGETIFALGGKMSNGTAPDSVEWFDWESRRWRQHDQSLLSKHTSTLAVTSFPLAAIDCHAGCSCGRAGHLGKTRIIGGSEVQVARQFDQV